MLILYSAFLTWLLQPYELVWSCTAGCLRGLPHTAASIRCLVEAERRSDGNIPERKSANVQKVRTATSVRPVNACSIAAAQHGACSLASCLLSKAVLIEWVPM